MPPKGKGRGRGSTPGRQDQPPPGQQRPEQPPGRGSTPGRQDQPPPGQQRPEQPPAGAAAPQRQQDPPQQQSRGSTPGRQDQPPPGQQRPEQPPGQPRQKPKFVPVDPEDINIKFERKLNIEPELPRDPGAGKSGKKIRLIANLFPVKLPDGTVYHYDVEIQSKRQSTTTGADANKKYRCLNTQRNREVIKYMLNTEALFRGIRAAYDGKKNMYTARPLRVETKLLISVDIPDNPPGNPDAPPRVDSFEVSIQPVRKKNSNSCAIELSSLTDIFQKRVTSVNQDAVMAIETVLRSTPCEIFVPVGRSFFYPPHPDEIHPLGGGREIWFGYHQSLRLGQWGPMVNLDMTASTFFQKGPVLFFIAELLRIRPDDFRNKKLSDAEIRMLSKEMKSLRVESTHLRAYRRKYRMLGLTREPANRLEFEITDRATGQRRKSTVANYFQQTYNIALKYPFLPCIHAAPKEKKIYLPVEVCEMVEGQHSKKKLEPRQTAEMIKFTARAPKQRLREINNIRQNASFERDEYLRDFQISVDSRPMAIEGRVLDPPSVRYQNDKKIRPRDGQWDMRDAMYFKGAEINSWVLLSFSRPQYCNMPCLEKFAHLLSKIGQDQGIKIGRPSLIEPGLNSRNANYATLLKAMKEKFRADLAVVVLPATNSTIYGEVKQAAETVIGMATQCVKDDNVVRKCNPALVSNLCQKVNAKMGGINNSLTPGETPEIMRRPVIVIGADVTHPGPSTEVRPSIAAAVGSLDAHPSRYAVTIRAQVNQDEKKMAIEYILDLKSMVKDLLIAFYRATKGKKPEKIIFFRDGVSEGQFGEVKSHEVLAIREACRSLDKDYEPGITFVVVQKRHHTRFFPQDERDGRGKQGNVPPGTTVDTSVTHPLNFDFFLCSHFGLQGTSRPAHYTVLEDDNKFTQDELQKLAYYLCHTYVRCTKSISVPAPVMYAHLAAYRARQHLATQYDESSANSDQTAASSASHSMVLSQVVLDSIKVLDILKDTMYFV